MSLIKKTRLILLAGLLIIIPLVSQAYPPTIVEIKSNIETGGIKAVIKETNPIELQDFEVLDQKFMPFEQTKIWTHRTGFFNEIISLSFLVAGQQPRKIFLHSCSNFEAMKEKAQLTFMDILIVDEYHATCSVRWG